MSRCPRCGWKLSTLDKDKVKTIQQDYPNAFMAWKHDDDARLTEMVEQKVALLEMAKVLGRQPSAINKRIGVLGLDKVKPVPEPPVNDTTYLDNEVARYRPPPRR